MVLEGRILGGDESGYEGLAGTPQDPPGLEGTGALIVILDKVAVVGDLADHRRHRIVEAGEEGVPFEVALTEVGGDGHIRRMALQCLGGDPPEPLEHLFLLITQGLDLFQEIGVDHISPGGVVDLQVAAAVVIQVPNGGLIGGGDIVDQAVDVAAVVGHFLDAHLQVVVHQDHIRAGDALFRGDTGVFGGLVPEEFKGLHLGVGPGRVIADLPGDVTIFDVVHLAGALLLQMLGGEAVKLLEPVQMPPSAAELPVGDELEAVGYLFFHQLCDLGVLHPAQLRQGELPGVVFGPGLLDRRGAQEGPDDVVFDVQHIVFSPFSPAGP